jgi:hypothetical protein
LWEALLWWDGQEPLPGTVPLRFEGKAGMVAERVCIGTSDFSIIDFVVSDFGFFVWSQLFGWHSGADNNPAPLYILESKNEKNPPGAQIFFDANASD